MEQKFIISIDQSTQGTKALLFDGCGKLLAREDQPHRPDRIIRDFTQVMGHPPLCIHQLTMGLILPCQQLPAAVKQ